MDFGIMIVLCVIGYFLGRKLQPEYAWSDEYQFDGTFKSHKNAFFLGLGHMYCILGVLYFIYMHINEYLPTFIW